MTLFNGTTYHLFEPLLYQVATGILAQGEVAPPVREIFKRRRNLDVTLGKVTDVDVAGKAVVVSAPDGRERRVPYDSLIVAAGARNSYFGNDGFAAHAPSLKNIDDALELRRRIFHAFEMAELEEDPEARRRWLTFVLVRAGPTGVELAGQIAELAKRALKGQYRIEARTKVWAGHRRARPGGPPRRGDAQASPRASILAIAAVRMRTP